MTLDWPHVIPCSNILFAENWVNFFLDNQWVSWVHLSDHKWPVLINSRYNNLSLSYGSSFIVNGEPWITARQPKCPRHSYFHFNCYYHYSLKSLIFDPFRQFCHVKMYLLKTFPSHILNKSIWSSMMFLFFIPLQTDRLCQIHDKLTMLPFWKYIAPEQKFQEPRRSTPEISA